MMFVLEFIGAAVFLASLVILFYMDRRRRVFLQAALMLAGLLAFGLQAWARFSEGKAGLLETCRSGRITEGRWPKRSPGTTLTNDEKSKILKNKSS